MRVHRKAVVGVRVNAMKFFAGFLHRIDVDDNIRQVADVMHRLVPHFLGKGVPFFDGKSRRNRHVHFGIQTVAQPARAHVGHFLNAADVSRGVPELINNFRIDPVERAG